MADATTHTLDELMATDGLATVTWEACDSIAGGELRASPADARGRGMAHYARRGGRPLDLSGGRLYLAWRHREAGTRGIEPMEVTDTASGAARVWWPAAMASDEGTADCQVVLTWGEGRSVSSPTFSVAVGPALMGTLATRDGFTLFAGAIRRYETATAELLALTAEIRDAKEAGELNGGGTGGGTGERGPAGRDGRDGKDGVSCTHSWNGTVLTVTSASGTSSADLRGPKGDKGDTGPQGPKGDGISYSDLTPEQLANIKGPKGDAGADGRDGRDGTDGVSCTHSWNGTVLTVTSASGTSSADLRGPKGAKGEKGATGETGPQGPEGPAGPQGPQGPAGKDGSATVDLSAYATMAWVQETFPDLTGVSF
ncbi:MAG: collagen-like protein [Olsenella sp.]|nr:collagen-like protein [Olsenella sp.]